MPTARFKAKGKPVSFPWGRKKRAKSSRARFEVWTVHDGGDRTVRRWKGASEADGAAKAKALALRGFIVDLMKCEGKRKLLLRSFGG